MIATPLAAPEQLLVTALRGEAASWPPAADATYEAALLAAAEDHGVTALVAATAAIHSWPERVQQAWRAVLRNEVVIEAIRRQLLQQVSVAFRDAGMHCLVIKGAQLAYTHYAQPWLRPRFDTDVLINPADRQRADAALRALGYVSKVQISGTLVAHQLQYERLDRYGLIDAIDLHWKITNPHLFADVMTFAELIGAAKPIPELSPALGPSAVHALLLACVHRVAHHHNSDRLIWLHDIHLLACAMDSRERDEFVETAHRKRVRSICAAGLDSAQRRFGTVHPPGWRERLVGGGEVSDVEPSSVFLQPGARRIDLLLWDLRALGGWTRKVRLLRETVFPPVSYVRARYGHDTPLVVAYLDRVVTGAKKWFRPSS